MYSSALTTNSQKYGLTMCASASNYYETIQVNVVTGGSYSLSSSSSIVTYGYLYTDHFNPFNLSENLLSKDYGSCNSRQFKLLTYLQADITYVLVVTTSFLRIEQKFLVLVTGPNKVTLNPISEYLNFINNQHRSKKYRKYL